MSLAMSVCFGQSEVLGKGKKDKPQQGSSGGSKGGGLGSQGRGQGGNTGSTGTGRGQGGGNTGSTGTGRGQGGGNTGSSTGSGRGQSGGSQGSQGGGLGNVGRGGQGNGGNVGRGSDTRGQGLGNVGRPNTQSQGSTGNNILNRRSQDLGRLGRPNYGSSNNQNTGRNNNNFGNTQRIERPKLDLRKGTLQNQVLREENVRYGQGNFSHNGYRTGYYSYGNNWRDDHFYYPYYQFSPFGRTSCTYSPWYYYPHCPGYLSTTRIIYVTNYNWDWQNGQRYDWFGYDDRGGYDYDRNDRYDRDNRDTDVDDALEDITRAFERQDRRALNRLVGRNGQVGIYMDGTYMYSLGNDDFYDLMLDNIYDTRTSRYKIYDVRTSRGEVEVAARHEFNDPWGFNQTVYHQYRLKDTRDGYVISDFMTSSYPTIDRR